MPKESDSNGIIVEDGSLPKFLGVALDMKGGESLNSLSQIL